MPYNRNRNINKELKLTLRAQISISKAIGLIYKEISALIFLTSPIVFTTL
jgi:hypothetical protein